MFRILLPTDNFPLVLVICFLCTKIKGNTIYYCQQGTSVPVSVNTTTEPVYISSNQNEAQTYYDNNMNCFWHIRTDPNSRLHFSVILNDLQYAPEGANCNGYDHFVFKEDYVSDYFDWSTAEIGTYFTWCGAEYPQYFSSQDNEVYFEFFTNDRNTYNERGVKIEVRPVTRGDCAPGWVQETSRQTDYCYKLSSHEQKWVDAQEYCNKEQANLVSFEDETEADFVTELIQNTSDITRRETVWIGLNDITTDSQYEWIDNKEMTIAFRWRQPYEANVYDNCVSIRKDSGLWQEEYCTESEIQTTVKNKFVCKTSKSSLTTIFPIPEPAPEGDNKDEGNNVPIIGIWLGLLFTFLLIVILVVVISFIICSRKQKNKRTRRGAPVQRSLYNDEGTELTVMTERPSEISVANIGQSRKLPSAPLMNDNGQHSPPPSYSDAVGIS